MTLVHPLEAALSCPGDESAVVPSTQPVSGVLPTWVDSNRDPVRERASSAIIDALQEDLEASPVSFVPTASADSTVPASSRAIRRLTLVRGRDAPSSQEEERGLRGVRVGEVSHPGPQGRRTRDISDEVPDNLERRELRLMESNDEPLVRRKVGM